MEVTWGGGWWLAAGPTNPTLSSVRARLSPRRDVDEIRVSVLCAYTRYYYYLLSDVLSLSLSLSRRRRRRRRRRHPIKGMKPRNCFG